MKNTIIEAKPKGSLKYGSWYYVSNDIWFKPMSVNDNLNTPPDFDINDNEWSVVDLDRAFTSKEKKEFYMEMQILFGDWKGGLTNIF